MSVCGMKIWNDLGNKHKDSPNVAILKKKTVWSLYSGDG